MADIVIKFRHRKTKNLKTCLYNWNTYVAKMGKADDSQISQDMFYESDFEESDGKTLVWNQNGDASVVDDFKNDLDINRSTSVWDFVIPFKEEFAHKVGLEYKTDYYNMTKEVVHRILLLNNINPSEIGWYSALHVNTSNPHVHMILYSKNKKIELERIPKTKLVKIRSIVANYLLNNSEFYIEKNKNINDIKKVIYKDKLNKPLKRIGFSDVYRRELNSKLLNLYSKLNDNGRLQYNSPIMNENRHYIDEITSYILSHYNLRYKFEKYHDSLIDYKKLSEQIYGKENGDYVENQIKKLYEQIGNDILKNYKVHKDLSFFEKEKDFLKHNIADFKFRSGELKNEKTFIKYAKNLYRICLLADCNNEQIIRIFTNWKNRSNYTFEVLSTIELLSKIEYKEFDKNEYFKALKTLKYNSKKYDNMKNKNFYKEIRYRNFFDNALRTLLYENEKVDEEILEMKERDYNYE
ncbi:MAG: relaxase MobL [Bacilli bacterium]|nr:relaxase MobL [Bacilli bacterium]